MNSSVSRSAILNRIRRALPQSAELPPPATEGEWQQFDDRVAQFRTVLKSVGGEAVRVRNIAEANAHLLQRETWQAAELRLSTVSGMGPGNVDERQIADPHELEKLGFAVLPGHFGVAENGAVWVTDDGAKHRVAFFIAQHMALVIPVDIVHNMHEAYGRIQPAKYAFSGFISGPSKTADIEQSLVIGAHGARSLVVYLVDEADSL
ncbi:MAG: LUD domain-containing protein [Planctomycetaceae bacterium]|nr:LUD domain-containing protein [Planctomycetaceae bacterium]